MQILSWNSVWGQSSKLYLRYLDRSWHDRFVVRILLWIQFCIYSSSFFSSCSMCENYLKVHGIWERASFQRENCRWFTEKSQNAVRFRACSFIKERKENRGKEARLIVIDQHELFASRYKKIDGVLALWFGNQS